MLCDFCPARTFLFVTPSWPAAKTDTARIKSLPDNQERMENSQQMLRRIALALALLAALLHGSGAVAAELEFDFKDPKEISAVSLALDSKLEPIVGYAKGLSGKIVFDPANPAATKGKIAVDVSSVQFANDGYTATARGPAGLNGDKYPQIFFTLKKVLNVVKTPANMFRATVLADFTCHGVTTSLTIPVTASYYPGLAEQRTNGKFRGDVLILRTHFNVSRTRQGISAGIPIELVGDVIEVRVACVGIHYAPGQQTSGKPAPVFVARGKNRKGRQI